MKYILASLVASAVAVRALEPFPGHQYIKRDLAARQTGSDSDYYECSSAMDYIYGSMPTPAPVLESYVLTATVTDTCSITLPPRVESALTSYVSEIEEWYSSNSAELESALSECTDYADVGETAFEDSCTTTQGRGGGTATTKSAKATATAGTGTGRTGTDADTDDENDNDSDSDSDSGSDSNSNSDSDNDSENDNDTTSGGSHDTGAITAAVMAAVGVLGVALIL